MYKRAAVQDALALIAVACGSQDEGAFQRLLNRSSRGVGRSATDSVLSIARNRRLSLMDVVKSIAEIGSISDSAGGVKNFSKKQQQGLREFRLAVSQVAAAISTRTVSTIVDASLAQTKEDVDGLIASSLCKDISRWVMQESSHAYGFLA